MVWRGAGILLSIVRKLDSKRECPVVADLMLVQNLDLWFYSSSLQDSKKSEKIGGYGLQRLDILYCARAVPWYNKIET